MTFLIYCPLASCREQKCMRSQKFAREGGLPILKNVLLPKTKGFNACLKILRDSLDAGFFSRLFSVNYLGWSFKIYDLEQYAFINQSFVY